MLFKWIRIDYAITMLDRWGIHGSPMVCRIVIALIVLFSVGCAPTITRFAVEPHEICPGTEVTTRWTTSGGRVSVTTAPELRPIAIRTYRPQATTLFLLHVNPLLGKAKSRESEVTVYAGSEGSSVVNISEIGFETECKNNRLVAAAERPASEWDERLTVDSIEIEEDRPVTVTHAGRSATLNEQAKKSDLFKGTLLSGTWSISMQLLSDEGCESGSNPSDLLVLTVSVSCGE